MNKKLAFYTVLVTVITLAGSATVFARVGEIGEQHRNETVKVVQELDKIANKDVAVKVEVAMVAKEEDEVSKSVSEKIKKVEGRNSFKTFLIGSDYKNLGALRSEIVTTQNRIDRLTKALDRASAITKTELETQINALKVILTKAESFVREQEGKFSLFGWMVRIFNK